MSLLSGGKNTDGKYSISLEDVRMKDVPVTETWFTVPTLDRTLQPLDIGTNVWVQ